MTPGPALRDLVLPVLITALLLPAAPRAAGDGSQPKPPREVLRLAHGSVDARFIPDPEDPKRDAVTGRERRALEIDAVEYYERLLREDPDRFDRIRRRLLGEETAESLTTHARRELVSGRPVSAEMSWRRVVDEHPQSPHAGPSLLYLGGSLLEAGERTQAAAELARLPDLDLESAMSAAPLMSRLLAEVEHDLEREGPVSGKDRLKLHDSVEDPGLDRARELSEWTSGWALVDEIARTLRLETSGDVLRKVKNVGADDLRLNKIVRLIPLDERVEAIRVEEMLRETAARLERPLVVHEDRHFLVPKDEFATWAEGRKQLRMEHFYCWLRRREGVLLDGEDRVSAWLGGVRISVMETP